MRASLFGVDPFDDRCLRSVLDVALAWRSFAPRIEALPGHAEPFAHELDREIGLLRFDEREHAHRAGLFFAAKKAAAFSSKSFSIRSTRTSDRNRFNSAFSSVVRP